jgi:hypothetical protein
MSLSSRAQLRPSPMPMDAPVAGHLVQAGDGRVELYRALLSDWQTDELTRRLFLAEIDAGARVDPDSQWIVPARGSMSGTVPWLAREYGALVLKDRLRMSRALPFGTLVAIARTVLNALDELASLGLVHSSPFPGNLVQCADGRLRLADCSSCRVAFAGGSHCTNEPQASQGDEALFLAWLYPLVQESAASRADRPTRELLAALGRSPGDAGRIGVLRDVVRAHGELNYDPVVPAVPAACEWSPGTVAVRLVVGPVRDERASYEAARILAPLCTKPLARMRAELQAGPVAVGTSFPHPLRALEASLSARRVPLRVELRAAIDASPTSGEERDPHPAARQSPPSGLSGARPELTQGPTEVRHHTSHAGFWGDLLLFVPRLVLTSLPDAGRRLASAWLRMLKEEAPRDTASAALKVVGLAGGIMLRLALLEGLTVAVIIGLARRALRG